MSKLTLKQFRELTKDFDENAVICVPSDGMENGLNLLVNFIHLAPEEHSHGNNSIITLGQTYTDCLKIKRLIGKNTWTREEINVTL